MNTLLYPLLSILVTFIYNNFRDESSVVGEILYFSGTQLPIVVVILLGSIGTFIYFSTASLEFRDLEEFRKSCIRLTIFVLYTVLFYKLCYMIIVDIYKIQELELEIGGYGYIGHDYTTVLSFFSIFTSYLIIDEIYKVKNWIFTEDSTDELIKSKLSFINKIIVGFVSIVASIVAIMVSIKQLIGK